MSRERAPRVRDGNSRRKPGGFLPRIDVGTAIPLGEYIFYGLAVLIGLAWFAQFVAVIVVAGDAPSKAFTILSGMVGTVMAGLVTVPRAFRRKSEDDDDAAD